VVAVVDGGGEEADAVGGGWGEALHGVDAGCKVAAVGELRDVRRCDGGVLVAGEVAGEEGDDEEAGEDSQRATGGSQDFGVARGRVGGGCGVGLDGGVFGGAVERSGWLGGLGVFYAGGGRVQDVDGGDEAVAALGEGLNVAWAFGGVAEGLADLVDGGAERVVEIDDRVTTPEAELEVLAGDDLSGALEERGKNFKGLRLQLNPKTGLPEFAALEVHLEKPEGEFRVGDGGRHCANRPRGLDFITRVSCVAIVDTATVSARRAGICQEIKN